MDHEPQMPLKCVYLVASRFIHVADGAPRESAETNVQAHTDAWGTVCDSHRFD